MSERFVPSRERIEVTEVSKDLLVANLADEIGVKRILKPIDEPERRRMNGEAVKIIGEFGLRVDSVEGLRGKMRNGNEEERGKASEAVDRLGRAVFLVMNGDERLRDFIPLGAAKIDEMLPMMWRTLGEEVLKPMIKTEDVLEVLDMVDAARRAVGDGNPLPSDVYELAIEDLTKIVKEKIRKGKMEEMKDADMVRTYLNNEAQVMTPVVDSGSRVGTASVEPVVDMGARNQYGEINRFGSVEGLERSATNLSVSREDLDELARMDDMEEIQAWVVEQIIKASENPLFFANWWQGGYSEHFAEFVSKVRGIERKVVKADDTGEISMNAEFIKIRDFTRAVCAVVGMEEADRNVDDTAVTLVQFNPPKNMAWEMMWSDDKFKLLKGHPQIGFFIEEIFRVAFEDEEAGYKGQGWKVARAFSSKESRDSMDSFCNEMIESLKDNPRWTVWCEQNGQDPKVSEDRSRLQSLQSFARVALAEFEVDSMPEWIRWCHANKNLPVNDRYRELAWFQHDPKPQGKGTWSNNMPFKVNIDGTAVKGEIPYNHPRSMHPAQLLLIKGSYVGNPRLVANFERVTDAMMMRRFIDDEGRLKPCRSSPQLDKYKKWAGFLELVQGKGIQGAEIDDLTDFGNAIVAAVNYWGPDDYMKPGGLRDLLSEMFAVKADALFWKGYSSGARGVLLDLMRLDPTYSSEDERRKALGGLIGGTKSGIRGNYGIFADAMRMYGMDFFGENGNDIAKDALVRLLMDEPDVEKAWKAYKRGSMILDIKSLGGIAGLAGGGGRGKR
jgi:hypothetical protein